MAVELTVPAGEFVDAVRRVSVAVASPRQKTPVLECVVLTAVAGSHWALVATDRYRLVEYRLSVPAPEADGEWLVRGVELKQAVAGVAVKGGPVTVYAWADFVAVRQGASDGWRVPTVDAKYPRVSSLWPESSSLSWSATVGRRELHGVVKEAVKAGDGRNRVVLSGVGGLAVAEVVGYENAIADVGVVPAALEEWGRVGFNGKFLVSLLPPGRGNVTLRGSAPTKPFMVTCDDRLEFCALLMPVRLGE